MKKNRFLILIILVITLAFCGKDSSIAQDNNPEGIVGEWIWLKSYGGFTGVALITPENTGMIKRITFMDNGTFIMIENGDTVQKANYFRSREESVLLNDTFDFLTINYKYPVSGNDPTIILPMRYMIHSLTDTLTIDEDVYDGFGYQYLRKK